MATCSWSLCPNQRVFEIPLNRTSRLAILVPSVLFFFKYIIRAHKVASSLCVCVEFELNEFACHPITFYQNIAVIEHFEFYDDRHLKRF